MRFLFVHGGWPGGRCWDQVARRPRAHGHETHEHLVAETGPLADALLRVCA